MSPLAVAVSVHTIHSTSLAEAVSEICVQPIELSPATVMGPV
jgi:hypothetical protein